jgi:hypothetical protein
METAVLPNSSREDGKTLWAFPLAIVPKEVENVP